VAWSDLNFASGRLAAPLPVWRATVDGGGWLAVSRHAAATGARLVSLWGEHGARGACVQAAYAGADGLLCVALPLDASRRFPDLAGLFPCVARMQRAAADLTGLQADGAHDDRPWLNHGLWAGLAPLAAGSQSAGASLDTLPSDYAFVRVEGDGVHEIAVGPVHAGIIEPGHFRFSVVGGEVMRGGGGRG
jgi:Respiratory-chain NADH dehydrogenase, 30 Kd subunit